LRIFPQSAEELSLARGHEGTAIIGAGSARNVGVEIAEASVARVRYQALTVKKFKERWDRRGGRE
jgi:hypothetical protein